MPASDSEKDQARFVFYGTVQKSGAATMPTITDTSRTAVVRVDQVTRGPEVCQDFLGKSVTVQAETTQTFKRLQKGIFYTNVSQVGDGLAVQLLTFEPQSAVAMAAITATAATPTAALKEHQLRQRVDSADVVVSGRVTQVHLVSEDADTAASGPALAGAVPGAPPREPISEHAPLWRDAVVAVEAVHKGTNPGKTVVIRYPASTDVRWFRAPKLQPGQEGVFILHSGELSTAAKGAGVAMAAAAPAVGGKVFTALNPDDFQPLESADRVREVLRATGG